MLILAIETSCDETAAAVVEEGCKILSSVVSTQIPFHQPYEGVVPELASRTHAITINRVIDAALTQAKRAPPDIHCVAVTVGPGLAGALLVGRMAAEAWGWVHRKPVIGVNHIEGHLLSPLLENHAIKPPFLGLVVSGGHTELIHAKKWGDYFLIGRTRDDAAGEAFDKVAKMMGLGYPGGPLIDQRARQGDPTVFRFPRPWLPGTWDFSFSGLKTAMLYQLRERKRWSEKDRNHLCAGFQASVVDILVAKTFAAADTLRVKSIVVGGGVAANRALRQRLTSEAAKRKVTLSIASPEFCTDNAAMIGAAAFFKKKKNMGHGALTIQPRMRLPMEAVPVPSGYFRGKNSSLSAGPR